MDDINGYDPDGTDVSGNDFPEPEPRDYPMEGDLALSYQDPDFDLNGREPTIPDLKKVIEDFSNPDLVTENGILGMKDTAQAIWGGIEEPPPMDKIFGEPSEDTKHWHMQEGLDTCAIVSQKYILDSYLDYDVTENELVEHATKNGYYYPGSGTFPEDVGKLLEDYGVAVERTEGNNFNDILEKLKTNEKIIVGVDANEIWANSSSEQLKDLFFMPEANHAVQVIGYNNESQTVILNDPGHPDGKGIKVNLSDFEKAWQDSNNFIVSATQPTSSASVA